LFGIKKLYDFIIKYRYYIAVFCLIILTILQYSGSKISILPKTIFEQEKSTQIFGIDVAYRIDEFGIETPLSISQEKNDFNYFGEILRGTRTDMSTVIHVPIKDISQIARIFNAGYLFLNTDNAIAFCWNLRIIAILLITFELMMIISNKKKYLSLIGSIMISFSPAMLFWGNLDVLFFGELVIVLIDKYMNTDKYKSRLLLSVFIAWGGISYIYHLYPGFIITFGYVFLGLLIWIVLKNIKEFKASKKDIFILLFMIGLVIAFFTRYFIISKDTINALMNTSYPGNRVETGGGGLLHTMAYTYSYIFNLHVMTDFLSYVNMNSFFPIPIILAIICIVQSKKHWKFLIPTLVIAGIQAIWCIFGYPEFLAKITLMNNLTAERCAVSLALINIYILIYLFANKEDLIINRKMKIIIIEIMILLILQIVIPINAYSEQYLFWLIIVYLVFIIEIVLLVNYQNEKIYKAVLVILCFHTLMIFWNLDITKGAGAVTDTDFAKKVQSIVEQDGDSLWMTDKIAFINLLPNYLVANGAKTINSINIYPNEEFYKVVLKDKFEENRDVWNRYAHITCQISETVNIYLEGGDHILIKIDNDTLKELNVKYIVSYRDKRELESEGVSLEMLYKKSHEKDEEAAIYIYELK